MSVNDSLELLWDRSGEVGHHHIADSHAIRSRVNGKSQGCLGTKKVAKSKAPDEATGKH